jgi:hypothetical protein
MASDLSAASSAIVGREDEAHLLSTSQLRTFMPFEMVGKRFQFNEEI